MAEEPGKAAVGCQLQYDAAAKGASLLYEAERLHYVRVALEHMKLNLTDGTKLQLHKQAQAPSGSLNRSRTQIA